MKLITIFKSFEDQILDIINEPIFWNNKESVGLQNKVGIAYDSISIVYHNLTSKEKTKIIEIERILFEMMMNPLNYRSEKRMLKIKAERKRRKIEQKNNEK